MLKLRHLFFVLATGICLLCLPEFALSIGRSGNGFVESKADGFTMSAPDYFSLSQPLPKDGLKLLAPDIRTSGFGLPPALELRRFAEEYSAESKLERNHVRTSFSANGWWIASHTDPCIEVFLSDNDSASVAVATWGSGKGVVMIGQRNGLTKSSIKKMLDTLELEPGACAWK